MNVVYGALSIFYVLTAVNYPINILAYATFDDAYFTTCARNIVAGEWLGPYSHMCLIKGPGYSLFLALTHLLGLPLALTTALVHLGACAAAVWVLRKAGLTGTWGIVIYFILLFQPTAFPDRIIRDYFNNSLAIFSIVGIIYIVIDRQAMYWKICLMGLACGFFLITREDPHWLLFAILFLASGKLIFIVFFEKSGIVRTILCISCYIVCAVLPTLAISEINRRHYGIFTVTDVVDPSFKRALKAIHSVKIGPDTGNIPLLDPNKINVIAEISPSFKEIAHHFTLPWSPGMKDVFSKVVANGYAPDAVLWALRGCVYFHGDYKNAHTARKFYARLAAEIEQACAENKLECHTNFIPFMPNISAESWKRGANELMRFVNTFFFTNTLHTFLEKKDADNSSKPALEPISNEQVFLRNFLGIIKYVGGYPMEIGGHYYTHDNQWFSVHCGDIEFVPAKKKGGLVAMLIKKDDALMSRFEFTVDNPSNCHIIFDGDKTVSVPLLDLQDVVSLEPVNMLIGVNKIQYTMDLGWGHSIILRLYPFFSIFNIGLFVFGTLAFCVNILYSLKNRIIPVSVLVAFGLWLGFYARFAFLFLVSISSFGASSPQYMVSMWPFMVMAAMLSLHTSWQMYLDRRKSL